MVSARRNEREGLPCSLELGRRGHCQQGPQIGNVLWTLHVITGQDLQGDQVAGPGDAHPQLRQKVDRLGIGGQSNNQVRVSRKPRFSSNGDGQTADERERDSGLSELGADLTKGGLE